MKGLTRRLEKLERAMTTDLLDVYFGFDQSRGRTGREKGISAKDSMEVERLGMLQCSDQEIAAWFGVSESVIQRCRQRRWFREATERGRAKSKIWVRRAQMQMLAKGNASIARWLGKQILGQGDEVEPADRPIPVIVLPRID